MRRGRAGVALLALPALVPAACVAPGAGSGAATGMGGLPAEEQLLVPPGHGSLTQEQITLTLRDGEVQIKVTPLEEWVIRLAAPDTYRSLSALARSHRAALEAGTAPGEPRLFLVSFFSDRDGALFHPEDLRLEDRGRRYAPRTVRAMTQGWGTHRLPAREARSAVYAYPEQVGLDADLVVEYRGVRNAEWSRVLADLLTEQARARARVGVGR